MQRALRGFFFNDTATTEIYTLSLHDALPIGGARPRSPAPSRPGSRRGRAGSPAGTRRRAPGMPRKPRCSTDRKSTRLNSSQRQYLVCRLLLEKKNNNRKRFVFDIALGDEECV